MSFLSRPIYSKKQIGFNRKKSLAMNDLLKKPGIAKILNNVPEKNEIYDAIKKEAGGRGLTRDGLKRVLWDFRQGGGKSISKVEIQEVAKVLFPNAGFGTPRYIPRKKEKTIPINDKMSSLRNAYAKHKTDLREEAQKNSSRVFQNTSQSENLKKGEMPKEGKKDSGASHNYSAMNFRANKF